MGVKVSGPKRVTYRAFFGLLRKTMPWRMLDLPVIPGTGLELAFIEYGPDGYKSMKAHMLPNAEENGIMGIDHTHLRLPLTGEAYDFLQRVFSQNIEVTGTLTVPLATGSILIEKGDGVHVDLFAKSTKADTEPRAVTIENVTLHV